MPDVARDLTGQRCFREAAADTVADEIEQSAVLDGPVVDRRRVPICLLDRPGQLGQ